MFKRFILAFTALLLSINISFADGESLKRYPLYKSMGPMYCGPLLQVNEMLQTEGFEVFALGFGRHASNRDGMIVYAILLYKHKGDKNNVVMTIETPKRIEKCILHNLWNFTLWDGKGEQPDPAEPTEQKYIKPGGTPISLSRSLSRNFMLKVRE